MAYTMSISEAIKYLDLTQKEASILLDVNDRTIRRWIENEHEVNNAAKNLLSAWCKLNKLGLAWRPGDIDITIKNGETVELDIDEIGKVIKFFSAGKTFQS